MLSRYRLAKWNTATRLVVNLPIRTHKKPQLGAASLRRGFLIPQSGPSKVLGTHADFFLDVFVNSQRLQP